MGAFVLGTTTQSVQAETWPDDFEGRLEVLALTEQLNAELLASRSATFTLEAWCADHHMAKLARLSASRDRDAEAPPTPEIRALLQVGHDEPVRYRRVALTCGEHVLSRAENWYVPARLTTDMNHMLDATDTPFGRAIAGLHPVRQTLSSDILWSPLPADWDRKPASSMARAQGALAIPRDIFRHRALLFDSRHRPIAAVVETYTREFLNFAHTSR